MKFDAYAALAKLRMEGGGSATPATYATQPLASAPHVARRTVPDGEISRQPVPANACRTSRTCRTGQAVKSENVIPLPPHIAAAVAEVFEEYWATDDLPNPRAFV